MYLQQLSILLSTGIYKPTIFNMYYVVGQHIDLSHLNTPTEIEPEVKSMQNERPKREFDVGTQFVFKFINGKYMTAVNIPVSFA